MAEIKVLSQAVADKIAAGEVAERPAAVVKELVENSIDAGADRITVEIQNGGIKYIRIEDNGKGILANELEFAFVRHATSKLQSIEDLFSITTMGFRGEALASICAVADVEVMTKTKDADEGVYMTLKHGIPSEKETVACNFGTTMIIQNLFANVPARMKFLKKDSTEAGYIADVLGRIALAKPEIAFRYICDGTEVFSTSGDGQLKNTILNIYGMDVAKGLMEVQHFEHGVNVCGVVGKAELARGNRTRQTLLVNGRYIKNHVVAKVVEEAYRNILMTGKFPFFVINIELAPEMVDVNVHPAKTEIKFANEKEVYDIVYHAVKNTLYTVPKEQTIEKTEKTEKSEEVLKNNNYNKFETSRATERSLIADFMKNTIPDPKKVTPLAFREPTKEEAAFVEKMVLTQKMGQEELEVKLQEKSVSEVDETLQLIEKKAETKIIGQVFNTYVIVEQANKVFLIDQHAAHERKRFEELKKDYMENKVLGQMLLVPIVLDVDNSERQLVLENAEKLSNMGFGIEEFGSNSIIIHETPVLAGENEIKELLLEILSALRDGRPSGILSFEERALDMISCKYAIKANKKLSIPEMDGILKIVEDLEKAGITTCPHGRPIKIEFDKRDIEKMFKRIV